MSISDRLSLCFGPDSRYNRVTSFQKQIQNMGGYEASASCSQLVE